MESCAQANEAKSLPSDAISATSNRLKTHAPRIQSRSVYEKDANDPRRNLRKFKDSNSKTDPINHFDPDPGTHTNANVMDRTNEFAANPFIT